MAFKETDYGRGRVVGHAFAERRHGPGAGQHAPEQAHEQVIEGRAIVVRPEQEYEPPRRSAALQLAMEYRRYLLAGGSSILCLTAALGTYLYLYSGAQAFPESGKVLVSTQIEAGAATARLQLRGDRRNAIVQLLEPEGLEPMMTIFIRTGQKRTLPVPPGSWRLRVIEGDTWLGSAKMFGPSTRTWLSQNTAVFSKGRTDEVDLVHAGLLAFVREDADAAEPRSALDAAPPAGHAK